MIDWLIIKSKKKNSSDNDTAKPLFSVDFFLFCFHFKFNSIKQSEMEWARENRRCRHWDFEMEKRRKKIKLNHFHHHHHHTMDQFRLVWLVAMVAVFYDFQWWSWKISGSFTNYEYFFSPSFFCFVLFGCNVK